MTKSMFSSMLIWFLFLLPFLPAPTVSGIPLSFVRIGALIFIFSWATKSLLNKKIILPLSVPGLFLGAFVFLSMVSVLWAASPTLAMRKEFLWLSIFPLSIIFWHKFFNGYDTDATENASMFRLRDATIASSAALGFLAITQFAAQFVFGYQAVSNFLAKNITPIFVGIPAAEIINQNSSWLVNIEGQTIMRSVVNFPEPHTLALFLGLTLPFALIAAITNSQKRLLYITASFLILTGLILTFSRGAYVALVFSLISIIPFVGHKLKTKKTGVILIFIITLFLFFGQPISSRFISSFDASEGSNAGRILIWEKAIEVFKQNPVVGVGLGNYPTTQDDLISSRSPINAHNTYLEIATELGLLGLLLWMGVLISTFLALFRRANPNTLAFGALSGLVFFSIHGFFETIIYSPQNLVLFSLILAAAFGANNKTKERITD